MIDHLVSSLPLLLRVQPEQLMEVWLILPHCLRDFSPLSCSIVPVSIRQSGMVVESCIRQYLRRTFIKGPGQRPSKEWISNDLLPPAGCQRLRSPPSSKVSVWWTYQELVCRLGQSPLVPSLTKVYQLPSKNPVSESVGALIQTVRNNGRNWNPYTDEHLV